MFELTGQQMVLLRWIRFYDSIYELDSVERPKETIIANDKQLDIWFGNYQAYINKRLVEYHKGQKTPHADRGIPKGRIVVGNT